MPQDLSRYWLGRMLAASIASLALFGLAVACVGDADGEGSTPAPTGAAADPGGGGVEPGAYPVTIEHRYGETEITEEPERVVVAGLLEQDAVLALGIVPVGTTKWAVGDYPGAIGPWAADKLGAAEPPTVLSFEDGIQHEKIASLRPDLIIAMYSGAAEKDYDLLSKIAPTIAQPVGQDDYEVAWRDVTRTVGAALGRPAQADRLIADVEARFAAAKAAHPDFAGKQALIASPYDGIFVYGPQDQRSRLLEDLGFTLPAALSELVGSRFGANISRERTDLLDVDVLMWFVETPEQKAEIRERELYANLDVASQGRDLFLDDGEPIVYDGFSFSSVLSIPDLLDALVPRLDAALDGNPGTPTG